MYNFQKLKVIRAKAALSTSKDSEKGTLGGGGTIMSAANGGGGIASAASLAHNDAAGSSAGRPPSRKDGSDTSYRCEQKDIQANLLIRYGPFPERPFAF